MSRRVLIVLALTGLVVVAYANSLVNAWAWDDGQLILRNEHLGDWSYVPQLFKNMWRPLKRLSFMVDYAVWGMNPLGFHLTSLGFHLAATLALYAVARRLGASLRLAFFAAALFAVHPVHVEAVANIANRKEAMSTLFYLLAFLAYLPLRRSLAWLPVVGLCYLLALLSKESAPIMLPVVLAAYELCYREPRASAAERRRLTWVAPPLVVGAFLFLLVGGFLKFGEYYSEEQIRWITQTDVGSWWPLVGNSLRAFVWDLRLLVWPSPLTIRHHFAFSATLLDARVLLAVAVLLLYAAAVWRLRRRAPLASFGLLWTGLNLLPLLNLVPVTWWFVSERFLYLPSAGFCLAAAHLFTAQAPPRLQRFAGAWRTALTAGFAALLGAATARTVTRNADWFSSGSIILAGVEEEPRNHFMLHWLTSLLQEMGDVTGAVASARRAIAVNPHYHATHFLLGQLLFAQGHVDEAQVEVQRAIDLNPYADHPWAVLGRIYVEQGKPDEALAAVNKGLSFHPRSETNRYLLADVLLRLDKTAEAATVIDQLLADDPDYGQGLAAKGRLLAQTDRLPEAMQFFRRAVEHKVKNPEAMMVAAEVSKELGDLDAARDYASRARDSNANAESRAAAQDFIDRLAPSPPRKGERP